MRRSPFGSFGQQRLHQAPSADSFGNSGSRQPQPLKRFNQSRGRSTVDHSERIMTAADISSVRTLGGRSRNSDNPRPAVVSSSLAVAPVSGTAVENEKYAYNLLDQAGNHVASKECAMVKNKRLDGKVKVQFDLDKTTMWVDPKELVLLSPNNHARSSSTIPTAQPPEHAIRFIPGEAWKLHFSEERHIGLLKIVGNLDQNDNDIITRNINDSGVKQLVVDVYSPSQEEFYLGNNWLSECVSLEHILIKGNYKHFIVGDRSMVFNDALKHVVIMDVKKISVGAFWLAANESLEQVTLPEDLENPTIGGGFLQACVKFSKLEYNTEDLRALKQVAIHIDIREDATITPYNGLSDTEKQRFMSLLDTNRALSKRGDVASSWVIPLLNNWNLS